MFRHPLPPLPSRRHFLRRFFANLAIGLGIILICLFIGMIGYRHFESLSWLDSFLNASMILSGMGPVNEMKTDGGKIFAGVYAIFSGVMLLTNAGIIFAPVLHRIYHKFHLADSDVDEDEDDQTVPK